MSYIRDYSEKPSFKPRGKSPFGVFLGVELEVEVARDYSRQDKAADVSDVFGSFAITKHDSSIAHGFEICSSPASLDYHTLAWNRFFNDEDTLDGLRAFNTKTCGIHIHISRAPLSSLQIGKMVVFIHNPENRKFIQRIAQRESNRYNNYVDGRKLTDATPKNCVKFQRHTAVNLLNPATVEIRIFKSNLSQSSFLKNLEFCQALVDFTWPGAHSVSESKQWKNFTRFVNKRRKAYPHLHAYLVEYKFIIPHRRPKITEEIIKPEPKPVEDSPDYVRTVQGMKILEGTETHDKHGIPRERKPMSPSWGKYTPTDGILLKRKKKIAAEKAAPMDAAVRQALDRAAEKVLDADPIDW